MEFFWKDVRTVMPIADCIRIRQLLVLLQGMISQFIEVTEMTDNLYECLFVYSLTWSFGGLLEPEDRLKFHQKLDSLSAPLPRTKSGETVFE